MAEKCAACGGIVRPLGSGYKCAFCGASFASIEELRPVSAAKPSGSTAVATENYDHGVDVFEMNINSVLEITWSDGQYLHSGSGFLISPDGYAVTNTHVVTYEDGESCDLVSVRICGENTTAEVIALGDDRHGEGTGVDLALIKLAYVPGRATVTRFGRFDTVRNGERIFVIGNSLGYGTCITGGIVSDRMREVNGKMLLMTDCAVNGGNSGGPMFNERGLVIAAIVSGISTAEGMNFAIPATTVLDFVNNSGHLRRRIDPV